MKFRRQSVVGAVVWSAALVSALFVSGTVLSIVDNSLASRAAYVEPNGGEDRTLDRFRPVRPRADVIVATTAHKTGRYVALTFDDGPHPTWTPRVLQLLARYRVRATFCLVGENVRAHPELVRRIVAAGHALCDHTVTHDQNLPSRPRSVMREEIGGGKQAILDAVPKAKVPYYRAPGGAFSKKDAVDSVQKIAAGMGMQPLGWSLDTLDWKDPDAAAIVAEVKDKIGPGDVVLLHDGGGDRSETVAALRVLLPWLIAKGYRFDVPRVFYSR